MGRGCFDNRGESFAQLTSDNRLKVWDIETGSSSSEYTPEGKLASELTALAWGTGSPVSSGTKKKRSKKATEVVAVGTARGDVLLWDATRNEVKATFGGEGTEQTARVNDLCFAAGGAQLLVCSEDGQVRCWDVGSGGLLWGLRAGKQPAQRLAVGEGGDQLATGGAAISLWDLATRTRARKLAGHAAPVTSLRYAPGQPLLLSAAADRFVCVWDAAPHATADAALRVLTLDAAPSLLAVAARGEALVVVAVSEAGAAGVWWLPNPRKKRKAPAAPAPPQCWIGQGQGAQVWGAAVDGGNVRLCRGSEVLPRFELVAVEGEDGGLVESVELAGVEGGGLLLGKSKEKKQRQSREAEAVQGADMPIKGLDTQSAGRRRDKMEVERAGDGDDAGSLDDDETLEAKVRALGLDVETGTVAVAGEEGGGVRADSVHVALAQALESDDRVLLAQCLAVTNQRVIETTVARLPPRTVPALLRKVVAKFQLRPARSVTLVAWIRALLTQHTALLMSQPDLVKSLTPLYQLVEARVSTYHKLLKLGGRLELALNQVGHRGGGKKDFEAKVPELVVDETGEADDVVGGVEDEADDDQEEGDEESMDEDDYEGEGEEGESADDEDDDDDENDD